LLRTGWGSSPSADGYGPRRPGSGPAIAGCRETGNRGKRVRAAALGLDGGLQAGAVLFCPNEGLGRAGWCWIGRAGTPPGRYRCRRVWGFVFCHPTRLSCSRWNLGADGWGGGRWAGGGRSGAVEQGGSPLRLPADPACAHTGLQPVSLVAGGMLRERFRRISYHTLGHAPGRSFLLPRHG